MGRRTEGDRQGNQVDGFTITPGRIPRWEEPGGTYMITFALRDRRCCDLSRPDLAPIIVGGLRHFNEKRYHLYDYTVMPDHVHAIIQPIPKGGKCEPLNRIMHSIKSWTANQLNRRLRRSGPPWVRRTHNRLLRSHREYQAKARYIWHNPIEAGLTRDRAAWPWTGNGQVTEGVEVDDDGGLEARPTGSGDPGDCYS